MATLGRVQFAMTAFPYVYMALWDVDEVYCRGLRREVSDDSAKREAQMGAKTG